MNDLDRLINAIVPEYENSSYEEDDLFLIAKAALVEDIAEQQQNNPDYNIFIDHNPSWLARTAINRYIAICDIAFDRYPDDAIKISDVTTLIDYLLGASWPVVEPVYTVVGTPNLFEAEWDPNYEKNDMVKGSDGRYHLYTGGYFTEGTEIYFKVVRNHNLNVSWPEENRLISIAETGGWDIEIIFDPNATGDQMFTLEINKLF